MRFSAGVIFLSAFAVLSSAKLLSADELPLTSKPNSDSTAQIKSDIGNADTAATGHDVAQIKHWIDRGQVPFDLWRQWLPALMNTRHYQEVADLSLAGAMGRPGIEAIEPLMEFRTKAMLALNKPQDALAAAKSYYNVCQTKNTGNALTLICSCLVACHPDDPGIAGRFRYQQAMASGAAYGTTQPSGQTSMLKDVKIDPDLFAKAISARKNQADQAGYANLLLVADQADKAEAIFRSLYLSGATQDDLTKATDGIVRSLRAEDGDVARADSWLLALQQSAASGQ